MRWIARLALIVALLALGFQFARPSDAQSPWPRYQVATSPAGSAGSFVRLDTWTGEMVEFLIAPPALYEKSKKFVTAEHGDFKFIEVARSAKETR